MLFEHKKSHDYSVDVNDSRNFVIMNHKNGSTREIPYQEFIGDLKYPCEIKGIISKYLPKDALVFYTFEAKERIDELVESNRLLY